MTQDEVALLVARHLGGQLQVHFVFAGDDADEVARLVTVQDEGLEHTIYVLAQAGGNMYRAQVAFVHLVGDQFVALVLLIFFIVLSYISEAMHCFNPFVLSVQRLCTTSLIALNYQFTAFKLSV